MHSDDCSSGLHNYCSPCDCECHNTISSSENDFTSKSYNIWVSMKIQCYLNPNKIIAVVTPRGRYELKYIPKRNYTQG